MTKLVYLLFMIVILWILLNEFLPTGGKFITRLVS
jgi:hypothetical protein